MKNFNLKKQYLMLIGVALLFNSCKSLCSSVCSEKACESGIEFYESSKHKIDLERSVALYDNYNIKIKPSVEERQRQLINREVYNPTEYVLINIETLKCYLKFLEEVEQKNNEKITGIAMFLGANDSNAKYKDLPFYNSKTEIGKSINQDGTVSAKDMRNRMTIFLAPTFEDTTKVYTDPIEKHQPFFIQPDNNVNKYYGTYTRLKDYFNGEIDDSESSKSDFSTQRSSILNKAKADPTSLALDELHTVPPQD